MADSINKQKKARSQSKKGYYTAQKTVTLKNKVRWVKRHLRSNPGDEQAKAYAKSAGIKLDGLGLTSKGRKLAARMAA